MLSIYANRVKHSILPSELASEHKNSINEVSGGDGGGKGLEAVEGLDFSTLKTDGDHFRDRWKIVVDLI